MVNLNNVTLQGNLVADPKIFGEGDKQVARFDIAVNNGFGEYTSTTFVPCVAFGGQVGAIGQFLTKGKQVIVQGWLKQSKWENKEGESRSRLEVELSRVNGFFFVSGTPQASNDETNEPVAAVTEAEAPVGKDLF